MMCVDSYLEVVSLPNMLLYQLKLPSKFVLEKYELQLQLFSNWKCYGYLWVGHYEKNNQKFVFIKLIFFFSQSKDNHCVLSSSVWRVSVCGYSGRDYLSHGYGV